ncbi:MAG: solute carrier family 23 protein [Streptococcus sp.]
MINIFTKGFIKSISILIGLIVGTAIAASMGLVDFSPVAAAPVSRANTILLRKPKFELSSIIMMCIIATVSMVESTGVYLALSDITKEPLDSTRLVTDTALKVWLFSLVDSSTPSIHWFFTKRWSCEVVRYQDSLANLLCRWFPCSSWTPS